MGLFNQLSRPLVPLLAYAQRPMAGSPVQSSWRDQYEVLRAYYENNGLYDQLQLGLREGGIRSEARKPLRNPAHRAVEFYASKLWPGALPDALPIEAEDEALAPAIQQVWEWSNWGARKQVAARWLAIYGDLFIKVTGRADNSRVFFQLIEPQHVTDMTVDERGFITSCRIDIPIAGTAADDAGAWSTEYWDKERYRLWRHRLTPQDPIGRLGAAVEDRALAEFGIDFVPIVHVKHQDTGGDRGAGCFTHAIDKIDEANRMATRLHQMMFRYNRPLMAVSANATDSQGRPLPAPQFAGPGGTVTGDLNVNDDTMLHLPGLSKAEFLVPQLNFGAFLDTIRAHMEELEEDMPELRYYRESQSANSSGIALRVRLSGAVDRLLEARGNAEQGLIRADQMALTIGKNNRLPLFTDIAGDYASGGFVHRFTGRPVIPLTETEEAAAQASQASTLVVKRELGISQRQALREMGYDDQRVEEMAAERADERESLGEEMRRLLDRGAGADS